MKQFSKETTDQFVATYYETKEKIMPDHYPDWVVAIDAAIYKGDYTDFNGHFRHYQPVMDAIIANERNRQRATSQDGLMIFWLFSPDYKHMPEVEDIETLPCFDCKKEVQEDLLIAHNDKRMGEIRVCEGCLKDIIWQEQKDANE